jgi:hypothetical protein
VTVMLSKGQPRSFVISFFTTDNLSCRWMLCNYTRITFNTAYRIFGKYSATRCFQKRETKFFRLWDFNWRFIFATLVRRFECVRLYRVWTVTWCLLVFGVTHGLFLRLADTDVSKLCHFYHGHVAHPIPAHLITLVNTKPEYPVFHYHYI